MTELLVNEIFWSIQGEGLCTGTPAVFIRLQGCHAGCPYCDTGYAARTDASFRLETNAPAIVTKEKSSAWHAAVTLDWLHAVIAKKRSSYKPCVILTGGEPFEQSVTELVQSLEDAHYPVHIETNGHYPLSVPRATWITLSPKAIGVYPENWARADEIKVPVRTRADIAPFSEALAAQDPRKILLQPIDCDPAATALCVHLCQEHNWRLSVQLHKYLGLR